MDKETLTLIAGVVRGLISLVAAVGVLLVNAKVDGSRAAWTRCRQ